MGDRDFRVSIANLPLGGRVDAIAAWLARPRGAATPALPQRSVGTAQLPLFPPPRHAGTQQTTVMHVDVDAFFPSVEQLLIPRLRNRPVAVGNGVIASCSYEARRLGLHTGMPLWQAKKVCPQVVILDGQYSIYRCFAEHIWQICRRYTDALETFLDEAYGDIRGMEAIFGQPLAMGRQIQAEIRQQVGLPVSIGLAGNRMLAKIASKAGKPAGVVWVEPGQEEDFLTELPVQSLQGVGPRTEALLRDLNITKVSQLRRLSRESLRAMLGERGEALYDRCRGRDVRTIRQKVIPRTISRETTFHEPECDVGQIRGMLFYLLERAMRAVRQAGLRTRTVELSICYDDWKGAAGHTTLPYPVDIDSEVFAAICQLLGRLHHRRVALRHVGIVLSHFSPAGDDPALFEDPAHRSRELHEVMDGIRDRWGHASLVKGDSINLLGRLGQDDYGFILRTPSLTK